MWRIHSDYRIPTEGQGDELVYPRSHSDTLAERDVSFNHKGLNHKSFFLLQYSVLLFSSVLQCLPLYGTAVRKLQLSSLKKWLKQKQNIGNMQYNLYLHEIIEPALHSWTNKLTRSPAIHNLAIYHRWQKQLTREQIAQRIEICVCMQLPWPAPPHFVLLERFPELKWSFALKKSAKVLKKHKSTGEEPRTAAAREPLTSYYHWMNSGTYDTFNQFYLLANGSKQEEKSCSTEKKRTLLHNKLPIQIRDEKLNFMIYNGVSNPRHLAWLKCTFQS